MIIDRGEFMQTDVRDVNELSSVSSELKSLTNDLDDSVDQLNFIIFSARDYDGIDISAAGNTLRKNLKTISSDMKNISRNISDYTTGIEELDKDDFTIDFDLFSLGNIASNIEDFVVSALDTTIITPTKKIVGAVENVTTDIIDVITTPITKVADTIEDMIKKD